MNLSRSPADRVTSHDRGSPFGASPRRAPVVGAVIRIGALSLLLLTLTLSSTACAEDTREAVDPIATGTVDPTMSTPDTAADVPAAAANEVLIENRDFAPTELTIRAGSTVRWINNDDTEHRILSVDEGVIDSGTLPPGVVFDQRFDTPGVIEYYCDIYNFMKGTITVE